MLLSLPKHRQVISIFVNPFASQFYSPKQLDKKPSVFTDIGIILLFTDAIKAVDEACDESQRTRVRQETARIV